MSSFALAYSGKNFHHANMKTVILLRHAQAVDGFQPVSDFDRALTAQGQEDILKVKHYLAHLKIDQAICSPALRTRQTLAALELSAPIDYDDAVYNASPERLLMKIWTCPETVETVLLVAHNPGIAELAVELQIHNEKIRNFPPASCAILEGNFSHWTDWNFHKAKLKDFARVQDL